MLFILKAYKFAGFYLSTLDYVRKLPQLRYEETEESNSFLREANFIQYTLKAFPSRGSNASFDK